MAKTKIEWLRDPVTGKEGYTINPVKGLCPMACPYCYARRMYKRFKWNPEIRMEPDWKDELPNKSCHVFVGSTMELFGDWVEEWMWDSIWEYLNDYPQHTFIFLTKQPQNLVKWSPFPENCWVGVSATNPQMFHEAEYKLQEISASVKFISVEPLLERMWLADINPTVDWVIIGQQTPVKLKNMPQVSWISEIVKACDQAGIPVFLKNNLNSCEIADYPELLDSKGNLRQEFPAKEAR